MASGRKHWTVLSVTRRRRSHEAHEETKITKNSLGAVIVLRDWCIVHISFTAEASRNIARAQAVLAASGETICNCCAMAS